MATNSFDQVRIRFLGTFDDPSVEQGFRLNHLREDIRLAMSCAAMVLLASFFYVVSGYLLYGWSTNYAILVAARTASGLASVGLIWALWRCSSPRKADGALAAWCLVVAASNLTIIGTRSSGNIGHALMSLGIPLVTYCILPLPLLQQTVVSFSFSLAALVVARLSGLDNLTFVVLTGAYLMGNAIGWFASWQLNRRRRQVYLSGLRETELRSHLEQAVAEIKTLRGLLPICSWCKRIRDEDHGWQPVESYVRNHSHAEFTHDICDDCARNHFFENATHLASRD